MTLGDFLKVYGNDEPFWINCPDGEGDYEAELFESIDDYRRTIAEDYPSENELPFREEDEVAYLTHGGDGILTVELRYEEA